MNQIGVDLIGEVRLSDDLIVKSILVKDWWGHANVKGETRNDSYYIYLIDKDRIRCGENAKAELKFKFSSIDGFKMKLSVGQVIELKGGSRKIGEFIIERIINKKLKYLH